jgi:hypothetical protein
METPANDLRNEAVSFVVNLRARVIDFMPNLLAAIVILVLGWIVARVVAFGVRGLLKRTQLDNRLATWTMGQRPGERPPQTERWVAAAVYWIILAFVVVAVLNALQLQAVSDPLNKFLGEIFAYLPRLGGALVLLGVGWAVATVARLAVIQELRRFNLDERLAQPLQPEAAAEGTAAKPEGGAEVAPFLLNEALGDALYWLIFLFFSTAYPGHAEPAGAAAASAKPAGSNPVDGTPHFGSAHHRCVGLVSSSHRAWDRFQFVGGSGS